MKSPIYLLLAVMLATPLTTPAAAEPHDHGAAPQNMVLNAGGKWATDEPLRHGMNAIKSSAAATLPLAHGGKARNADYDAFAKEVTAQINTIVQKCKLVPKADAQLHIVVGDIMAGVEMAEGKHVSKRAAGVVKVVQALNMYGKYFSHPEWTPLALPH